MRAWRADKRILWIICIERLKVLFPDLEVQIWRRECKETVVQKTRFIIMAFESFSLDFCTLVWWILHILVTRPVPKQWLCKQKHLLGNVRNHRTTGLCNLFLRLGSVRTFTSEADARINKGTVISVGFTPRLYSEEPSPAECSSVEWSEVNWSS